MPKLIVLDGPDNIGKSTQVEILKKHYNAKQIIQPSGDNLVGFLRDIVKNKKEIDSFPRQLLHTVSHVVDAFTQFSGSESDVYIMDRCHASVMAYGLATGMTGWEVYLLMKIHQEVYQHALKDFKVYVSILNRKSRFSEDTTDKFETTFRWKTVSENYDILANDLLMDRLYLFKQNENIQRLDVTPFSIEELTERLIEFNDRV